MAPKEDHCPKCNTAKSGESCPKCGLVFAKFSEQVLLEGVSEELKLLWKAVEERWDEKSSHAIFMERALASNAGGYAAACYRSKINDPVAEEHLELITKRLEQMLYAGASRSGTIRSRGRLIGGVLLVFVLLGLIFLFLYFSQPAKG